jgi:hypothetical protein
MELSICTWLSIKPGSIKEEAPDPALAISRIEEIFPFSTVTEAG